jgi:hypothetical protein
MILANIIENCPIFKNKNTAQMEKLLNAIQTTYGNAAGKIT